jgi:hypothetical protein
MGNEQTHEADKEDFVLPLELQDEEGNPVLIPPSHPSFKLALQQLAEQEPRTFQEYRAANARAQEPVDFDGTLFVAR